MNLRSRLRTSRGCRSKVQSKTWYSRSRKLRRAKPRRGLPARADLQLLEQVVDVILHCRDLDVQLGRDLLVRQPAFEQRRDFPLARRERQRETIDAGLGRLHA